MCLLRCNVPPPAHPAPRTSGPCPPDCVSAVISTFEAAAHPGLRAAGEEVLALVTAEDSTPLTGVALLQALEAARAEIEATVARPRAGEVVTARGRKKKRGVQLTRRGGVKVFKLLRQGRETHWRVHPHLIPTEAKQVRGREGQARATGTQMPTHRAHLDT